MVAGNPFSSGINIARNAFLDRIIPIIILLSLLGLGFGEILRRLSRTFNNIEFANQYSNQLPKYVDSNGQDFEVLEWLIRKSHKMQVQLGSRGILALYRPAYSTTQYQNYPVLPNMLTELRDAYTFSDPELPNKIAINIYEIILGHVGRLDDVLEELRSQIKNPFIWFREGTRTILAFPTLLLVWLGIIGARSAQRITSNLLFKLFAGIVSMIGLLASIMTIILGWGDFLDVFRK